MADAATSGIFVTWSAKLRDLTKARVIVSKLVANGNVIRGCSYDVKVSAHERCPICHNAGLKAPQ